jgi:hypothetical protein
MFQQPDEFAGLAGRDAGGPFLHQANGNVVVDRLPADGPSYRHW